jgi:hypothetical protein
VRFAQLFATKIDNHKNYVMRKNLIITGCIFLFALLFFPGCQKQAKENTFSENASDEYSRVHHGIKREGCRLISTKSEFGEETYTYNRKGLLDQWFTSFYGGYFKQEYDRGDRLIKSKLYVDGTVANTVNFLYSKDKVVKETWYLGETTEKTDEITYQYNWAGKIKKAVSILGDYTIDFTYTREGNLLTGLMSLGGLPYYSVEFTYLHRHKTPFSAIPGLEYDYSYAFGTFNQNKWYSSSEKDILYDENGNPIVQVDQDPYKTIVKTNRKDYVTASDFYDKLTREYIHFRFDYENCGRDEDHGESHRQPSPLTHEKPRPFQLKKGSAKAMKEKLNEFRKQQKK